MSPCSNQRRKLTDWRQWLQASNEILENTAITAIKWRQSRDKPWLRIRRWKKFLLCSVSPFWRDCRNCEQAWRPTCVWGGTAQRFRVLIHDVNQGDNQVSQAEWICNTDTMWDPWDAVWNPTGREDSLILSGICWEDVLSSADDSTLMTHKAMMLYLPQ